MPLDPRYPFWVHGLIELPAGLNFLLRPSEQLSSPAPQAHPIIRQYGTLLLSSVIVALIFGTQPISTSSQNVAGALALYHLAPLARAFRRIYEGGVQYGKGLGGP
ncbi:hypothetical protein B0O99DRAFT_480858, partial [Bisporella sp. PMI_857]